MLSIGLVTIGTDGLGAAGTVLVGAVGADRRRSANVNPPPLGDDAIGALPPPPPMPKSARVNPPPLGAVGLAIGTLSLLLVVHVMPWKHPC